MKGQFGYLLGRHLLPRLGFLPRRWIDELAHWWGWKAWIDDEWTHKHLPDCPEVDLYTEAKEGGLVQRCRNCGMPVKIRMGFWETDDGHVPEEVIAWIAEELKAIAVTP